MPLHTHYENLKVARNAPPEVIRAAYRVLAQRYHPDVNPSPDAARVMMLLNEAYAVLSDPQRRGAHDAWIEEQLIKEALDEARAYSSHEYGARATSSRQARDVDDDPEGALERSQPSALVRLNRWLGTAAGTKLGVGAIAGAFFFAWLWLTKAPTRSSYAPSPLAAATPQAEQSRKAPSYVPFNGVLDPPTEPRPSAAAFLDEKPTPRTFSFEEARGAAPSPPSGRPRTAAAGPSTSASAWSPNGKPWPTRAAYLDGFQRRASSGLSTLTIDNTSGGADVHVKLCRASADRCDGLRHIFIPLGASFTMSTITPGQYDIRYRALDNGALAKSEPIALEQIEEVRGIRYSTVRLTLYRVAGGNTTFESLPEDKF